MAQRRAPRWIGITLLLLAVVGVAIALTAVFTSLPPPPVGGTCGPGRGAESAIAAFFDPGSIGAGREPAGNTVAHLQWYAFVGQCQAATSSRMLIGLAVLVLALLVGVAGFLVLRRSLAAAEPGPGDPGADHLEPGWDLAGGGSAPPPSPPDALGAPDPGVPHDLAPVPGAPPDPGTPPVEGRGGPGDGSPESGETSPGVAAHRLE
jgi:hypothetical protein